MASQIISQQWEISEEADRVSGIFVLTSAESKRLIAKAVAALPQVQRALREGRVIIANGTSNAFVAEEILGIQVPKYKYAAGYIGPEGPGATAAHERLKPYVLVKGIPVDAALDQAVQEFTAHDVFIKGANAVDTQGHVGILMAGDQGGTIGASLATLTAKGAYLIVPVGLEKLVPSVRDAAVRCGKLRFKYHMGLPVGLMPVINALVVTEVQALSVLTGVRATHVASGGIGGCEGGIVLVVEGEDDAVRRTFDLVETIKGESPITVPATSGK